jgi:hypothetical protein
LIEHLLAVFSNSYRQFRGRFRSENLGKSILLIFLVPENRFPANPAAATLLSHVGTPPCHRLSGSNRYKKFPKIIPAVKVVEITFRHSSIKTVHRTKRNIFFIGIPAWHSFKFSPGEADQLVKIVVPDFSGNFVIPFGKPQLPLRDHLGHS